MIAAGISTSILYAVVGLISELQMFGDGSIFSYAVAAQDAWSFHWHNISGRLFTYVFAYIPAEAYVALTKNAKGGIVVYGLLFFSAQMLGLLATLAADRTTSRVIFGYACLSTACLCPLVFGAPTEMWMAHAVFWPALAVCLCAPSNLRGAAAVFVGLLALLFTHEGAIVLSAAILFALFLRGWRDVIFVRALGSFFIVMTIWLIVKMTIRPDDYIAGVLAAAAYKFIDIRNLAEPAFLLLLTALAGYAIAAVLLRRAESGKSACLRSLCLRRRPRCVLGLVRQITPHRGKVQFEDGPADRDACARRSGRGACNARRGAAKISASALGAVGGHSREEPESADDLRRNPADDARICSRDVEIRLGVGGLQGGGANARDGDGF